MIERRAKIRTSIIPDSSVKLLELCLSDEENGIFIPTTQRKTSNIEFRGDWALQNVITERIQKSYSQPNIQPLVLRKRELLKSKKQIKKSTEETQKIEEIFKQGNVPIMMRKFLLYQQIRAG